MKKIVMFVCLLTLVACSNHPMPTPNENGGADKTHDTAIETRTPMSASQSESIETAPIITPLSTEDSDIQPYAFSTYNPTSFEILDRIIPAGECSGDMSEAMCIEMYGEKSSVPDGITVELVNADDHYHYFQIENSLTGNSVEIGIINGMYDSYLSDVVYSLQDDNRLTVSFYFDYTDEMIENHPNAYDIQQRYYQTAGPIHSHTRYHLVEGQTYTMEGEVIASTDCFILGKLQAFDYLELMDDVDFSLIGIEYLQGCDLVMLV